MAADEDAVKDKAEALKNEGNVFFQNSRFNDAVDKYNDAIELNPEVCPRHIPGTCLPVAAAQISRHLKIFSPRHILCHPPETSNKNHLTVYVCTVACVLLQPSFLPPQNGKPRLGNR